MNVNVTLRSLATWVEASNTGQEHNKLYNRNNK